MSCRVLFPVHPLTVGDALTYNTQFSMFMQVLITSGNQALLNSTTANVTVLVPTNKAFNSQLLTMVGIGHEGMNLGVSPKFS